MNWEALESGVEGGKGNSQSKPGMTASFTTLPTELLYDIIEHLDRQSVLHCALTCRLLAKIVAAKLWRVIPRLTPQKTVQLFQALSTSTNAGTEILEINISGVSAFRCQSKPSAPRPPTFHEVIARGLSGLFQSSKPQSSTSTTTAGANELSFQTFSIAFGKMIHLRKLVIHGPLRPGSWGFTLFIPTLREVFVYRHAESIELLNWIKGQSNLTRLRFRVPQDWSHVGSFLPNKRTISLPQLRSITTTPHGAKLLLQFSSASNLIIEDIVNATSRQAISAHDLSKTIVQENISGILKHLTLVGRDDDVLNLLVLLQGHLSDFRSLRIVFSNQIHGTFDFPSTVRDLPNCTLIT